MAKFYDMSDGSEEAQTFYAILSDLYRYADTHGIKAAVGKFAAEYPFYAESLEEAVEDGEEFEFLYCDDDEEIVDEPGDAERRHKLVTEALREATGRIDGQYMDETGDKFIWDGKEWTDPCGNRFSKLSRALGIFDYKEKNEI